MVMTTPTDITKLQKKKKKKGEKKNPNGSELKKRIYY
jgi:hypothetical protein